MALLLEMCALQDVGNHQYCFMSWLLFNSSTNADYEVRIIILFPPWEAQQEGNIIVVSPPKKLKIAHK